MRRLTVFGFVSLFLSTAASAQTDSKETFLSGHKGSLEGHTRAPAARASPIQIRRWAARWIFASPGLLAGARRAITCRR